ncbi:S8 family peptidase [Oharaeibacter diazotrophicus]|uniref:Subtilase family protein n=1 Tax=Oharaeibacter diazotrophicus TaxID=1920512 RepID=A0A4R6RM03_9HYPH|nr:S8 family serine peptidase [Oharaeibacter diazotrophicus]TDP87017.1 subtilase family protein [Oharaeibacter diazotrophicus]BBE71040.1 subtilisin NAT precursor [Pleomorphomonas sp. SM30]GLS77790.1 hypothetical protein GCM10007904_31270 [Oharaeibacter diazotrophicus]
MKFAFAALLAVSTAMSVSTASAQQVAVGSNFTPSVLALRSQALAEGTTRVIVEYDPSAGRAVGQSSDGTESYSAQGASIAASVFGAGASVKALDAVPMFAADANADQIASLAGDSRVVKIYPDRLAAPTLLQSLQLIKMNTTGGAYSMGATGAGRAVVVIDTGVDKTHEFLRGKVVSEACYSTTSAANQSTSLCPNGAKSSIAAGSGLDCNGAAIEGCGHGTHVAGIAAGKNTSLSRGEPQNGVAKDAAIVAIKVFSKFATSQCGSGATMPCALAYTSDQLAALERVYALRNGVANRKIDAVNMSLGGGGYDDYCDDSPLTPIIDKLRRAGIAVVIAAGNSSYINGVGAPGCIYAATTVSASSKKATGKPERIAYYSNIGPQTDIVAPGGDVQYPFGNSSGAILSSTGGTYKGFQGTSMAAPHVAGIFAAIRSRAACRTKSVGDIEYAMWQSGLKIQDYRSVSGYPQITRSRVDVPATIKALGCG